VLYPGGRVQYIKFAEGADNNVVIIPFANMYTAGAERVREEVEGGQGCRIFFSTFTV